jgi:GTP-binding protein
LVVINKVDKPNCRPDEVHDAVFELFFNLDATEEQLNFPTFYGSGKNGWFNDSLTQTEDILPLMDGIIKHVPAPKVNEGTLQMQITSLDYSSFLGRIAIGKVTRGLVKEGQTIALVQADGSIKKSKVKELYVFEGMGKRKVLEVISGDLCAVVGLEDFNIGDTICDIENPEALPVISVDEPTMSMLFSINNSPFFGKDGKFVTSRHLRDRLMKETEKNLALKVEDTDSADSFLVYGRGILHLGILVETMRREGYELTVGNPQVLIKQVDGKKHEYQWVTDPTTGSPVLDQNGNLIDRVDENGQKVIRPRGLSDRAIIATQTLAIQELSKQVSTLQSRVGQLTTWAQSQGFSQ